MDEHDKPHKPLSQTERNKRWQEQNKDRARYLSARSSARSFIRNRATKEDLDELEQLIAERRQQL
ncbi:hypothetical protein J32TS2_28310 [Shouchella clausii]|uniref:hypothetical protein n=1 Tax=Shouchella clausii TaxID=79880 RepID=UPI001B17E1D2|nr:hypothetical protein [Shouchella clausii]GIN17475.1 hypothetical protein J32TS2_28310 [Shouchella clausii]